MILKRSAQLNRVNGGEVKLKSLTMSTLIAINIDKAQIMYYFLYSYIGPNKNNLMKKFISRNNEGSNLYYIFRIGYIYQTNVKRKLKYKCNVPSSDGSI